MALFSNHGLKLRLPISTFSYQTQQERTTKCLVLTYNASLSQTSDNITTPSIVYSKLVHYFYYYCYRCIRLPILIILAYGSLKQHPSCVSPLLPPLCWARSVPKLSLCLRTTHTMASLLVLLSHSHGVVMALYVSLLGYCEPHVDKLICVASHH